MRIFKNRGDIYFSKTNKKRSAEQKILITALVVIVVFTLVFVTVLAFKYDFSAKKFFAPDDLEPSNITDVQEEPLPEVSGKSNFIVLVHSDENLLFTILLQTDFDNVSYKAAVLKADTLCDGNSLSEIYIKNGVQNVQTAVETLLGTEIDYYIEMQSNDFADFFDELGEFHYPIASEISFRSKGEEVNYSVRIKAGEQEINGSDFVNLIRYYAEQEENFTAANDLVLNSLQQKINSENQEKKEKLFNNFVAAANTNITVRDFSLGQDRLTVLTDDRTGTGAYSAVCEYEENTITQQSLQKIKGYFVK